MRPIFIVMWIWNIFWITGMIYNCGIENGEKQAVKDYDMNWPKTFLDCNMHLGPGTYDFTHTIYLEKVASSQYKNKRYINETI